MSTVEYFNSISTFAVAIIATAVMLAIFIYFHMSDVSNRNHFNWHKVIDNYFHLNLTLKGKKLFVLEIHYCAEVSKIKYKESNSYKAVLCLPKHVSKNELKEFSKNFQCNNRVFLNLIRGIHDEKTMSTMELDKSEIEYYHDFRMTFLKEILKVQK